MGRTKNKNPKTRHNYSLGCLKELRALRDRLTPPGLEMTDGQTIDIIVATMHGVIIEKSLEIVDPDRMMELINVQFRKQFVDSMVKVLSELGHSNIHTELHADLSVHVTCDEGGFTVPAEVFGRADADSRLRELKTGLEN